jgi:succinoglycan biosynthesis transport protein ExoP
MESIQDLKTLIKRRYLVFLLASIPVCIIATAVALRLPPIYVAKSTILIESQQIPEEYVKATVTGYIEERLQTITQQILSRANLLNIIKQFGLYPEMQKNYATEIIVEKMRKDINLETIQASGRRNLPTIAFTLSYEGKNPIVVQKIANVLASLYLEENLKKREAQATRTTEFLRKELNHIKDQIDEYGKKISDFKQAHFGELPEYTSINVQAIEQLSRDFDQADMQIRSLQERKVYLEGQLTAMESAFSTTEEGGKFLTSPSERLRSLQMQLINLRSNLSEKHPDVVKLKREIEDLEAQMKKPETTSESVLASTDLESPAYMNLKTQIESTKMDIANLVSEKERIKKKIGYYQKKIENTPLIEKEYESLNTDYVNAKQKYNEIMGKLLESEVAQGMEETQHGERFTIIEPASVPETPAKPNRPKILLMGLFLSLGLGGGLAFVQETFDHSIKTIHELDEFSDIPVLSVIPLMVTDKEINRKRMIIISSAVIAAVVLFGALIAIHFFYMPLDIAMVKVKKALMVGR